MRSPGAAAASDSLQYQLNLLLLLLLLLLQPATCLGRLSSSVSIHPIIPHRRSGRTQLRQQQQHQQQQQQCMYAYVSPYSLRHQSPLGTALLLSSSSNNNNHNRTNLYSLSSSNSSSNVPASLSELIDQLAARKDPRSRYAGLPGNRGPPSGYGVA